MYSRLLLCKMHHKLLLVACFAIACANFAKADGLDNFVTQKMAAYSSWLKRHNLDPSQTQGPDTFQTTDPMARLNCRLENHTIHGFSDGITLNHMNTHLNDWYFSVHFTACGNITMSGKYSVNGTVDYERYEIFSEGSWHINVPCISTHLFGIYFYGMENGFLNVTRHDLFDIVIPDHGLNMQFENLWDTGIGAEYEEYVKDAMLAGFRSYLRGNRHETGHPIRAAFVQYWLEVMSTTTLEDIINTAEHPLPSA